MRSFVLTTYLIFQSWASANTYIVASQDFDYYPHYDFSAPTDKGFIWSVLEAYSAYSGDTFIYQSMPVMRLQIELEKGTVDLIYPDNPLFTSAVKKYYSETVVTTVGGTILPPNDVGKGIDRIKRLSLPLGFTPQIGWNDRLQEGRLKLEEVNDCLSALQMVTMGRSQAADVDFFVAKHLSRAYPALGQFTLDPDLPHAPVKFMLATVKQRALIDKINGFLSSHPGLIEELKHRYGLEDPELVFKRLEQH